MQRSQSHAGVHKCFEIQVRKAHLDNSSVDNRTMLQHSHRVKYRSREHSERDQVTLDCTCAVKYKSGGHIWIAGASTAEPRWSGQVPFRPFGAMCLLDLKGSKETRALLQRTQGIPFCPAVHPSWHKKAVGVQMPGRLAGSRTGCQHYATGNDGRTHFLRSVLHRMVENTRLCPCRSALRLICVQLNYEIQSES